MSVSTAEFAIPTANSGALDITRGPDGNLWAAEQYAHKVARITPSGAITEYSVTGDPVDVIAGSGTDLWFSEFNANLVGKIDTSDGAITEFSVPTPDSEPNGITLGADGAIWFGEYSSGKIGRVSTDNQITEFTVGGNPTDLALGSDGNVWFTSYNTDQVGKLTTAGSVTMFALPSGTGPAGIAAGADGNLWVNGYNSGQILRVSTSGSSTSFNIPTSNSHPWAIQASTDGTLWFAESGANQVGRVSTLGLFREYSIPTANSDPRGIAVGTDGSAWWTEYGGNQFGEILASATPSMSLTVTYGTGRMVTLSGQVQDDEAEGLTVAFSGKVTGSVVTNADGTFSGTFEAIGLGDVEATVTNGLGFSANASVLLASDTPTISDFTASAGPVRFWTFQGKVTDESAAGLTVTFGGLTSLEGQTTTVKADGTFEITVQLAVGERGTASAQVTDPFGLESELALVVVAP